MKHLSAILLVGMLFTHTLQAQWEEILPVEMTPTERATIDWQHFVEGFAPTRSSTPPPGPVRSMAEWEELEAIVITWRSFPSILTEIVRHASQEVEVYILCRNVSTRQSAISQLQAAGIPLDKVRFFIIDNNSVWVRDYGPNCVYADDVGQRYFIDWIYNRPSRPKDNVSPVLLGDSLGIPVYTMTTPPYDLVNTGGNFNADGLGTAFCSKLVLDENKPGNIYGVGPHDELAIDTIMQRFMGIERYIKLETLPYDVIHHIDMHMKLLDERTLLVGQYPPGVADGPQIEANLQYILDHFPTASGQPWQVVRIIQPPDFDGSWPNNGGDYRTYTNSVFVNKTILVPTYEEKYDTTALRIYREQFPGYKVVGINVNEMIWANGALHCITKEVGSPDPLWIAHERLADIDDNETWADYPVEAIIKHSSGVASATLYYSVDTSAGYQAIPMEQDPSDTSRWLAFIPHQPNGTEVFYYLTATAFSGKKQVRPLTAPAGFFHFRVRGTVAAGEMGQPLEVSAIYPNPANGITVVPVALHRPARVTLQVFNVLGQVVQTSFDGELPAGWHRLYLRADRLAPGTYFVVIGSEDSRVGRRLAVR